MDNVSEVSLGGFKLVENASPFNENFKQNYNEDSDGGHFFEVDIHDFWKITQISWWFILFAWKDENSERSEKLVANLHD